MRVLSKQECQHVSAAGWVPRLNEDKDIVMSVEWGFAAVGGMIGAALYEWKGLLIGFGIGMITWPVAKEVFQGFPHLKKWFGSNKEASAEEGAS
ncbi:MAG: hypothetical protein CMF48_04605 [Legionellales bacterium]|nr:hypothetical protein [Legionellales bacterium]